MANYQTKLKAGDTAPDFNCNNEKGEVLSLKNYKDKKLILYFYPKDKTPSCTNEACDLRDNYKKLKENGYEVLGVSADNEVMHEKFIKKYDLPFPLLADTDMKVIKDYDVWGEKKFMGRIFDGIIRTTFIINEKGKIERVINDVDTKNHAYQILNNYNNNN